MLSSVLTKEKCSKCRNCCVFFSSSRWEMPSVTKETADKICEFLKSDDAVAMRDGVYKLNSVLRDNIKNNSEEYKCPALDENSGCTLPDELKPIECSMWPLRVMNDNGRIFIALAGGCNAVDNAFTESINKLLESGLAKDIIILTKKHNDMIRKYDKSYLKLKDITKEIQTDEQ